MEFILTHPDTGTKTITVLFDGVPYEADSNHPWWDEIIDLVLDDDPRVLDLFPIRPVQQPSSPIEEEPSDIGPTFEYLDKEDLPRIRSIMDEIGLPICGNLACPYCAGIRA